MTVSLGTANGSAVMEEAFRRARATDTLAPVSLVPDFAGLNWVKSFAILRLGAICYDPAPPAQGGSTAIAPCRRGG